MSRRAVAGAVILAVALGFALGRATAGASRPAPEPPPRLRAVVVPQLTEVPSSGASRSPVAEETGSEATGEHPMPGPGAALPLVPAPSPSDTLSEPAPSGMAALNGLASWYCRPAVSPCTAGSPADRMAAAAGPALRVGSWRGSWITVSAGGRSVRVQLVDVCQCYGTRLLDLYAGAFAQLAPLGRGLVVVEVTA